jgi:histone H3
MRRETAASLHTHRWKGSLRMSSSVLFWYLRISRSATVPGR